MQAESGCDLEMTSKSYSVAEVIKIIKCEYYNKYMHMQSDQNSCF